MDTGRGGATAFFDGVNVWAVGGGWSSYLGSTEYFDGQAKPVPAVQPEVIIGPLVILPANDSGGASNFRLHTRF